MVIAKLEMKVTILCGVFVLLFAISDAKPRAAIVESDDDHMHSNAFARTKRGARRDRDFELTTEYWLQKAQSTLNDKLHQKINTNKAKNVIMFLGDGMSIPTLAAARAYIGQLNGNPGEESVLSFEEFPHTGLSKTYCVDSQVADSACSGTAYLCGVKANIGTIGVNGNVPRNDWEQSMNKSNQVTSIARWSQLKNKRTGVVTTTRITHATPTGLYANIGNRDWECDHDLNKDGYDSDVVDDIAEQLVRGETGKNFNVILGGGRQKFLPNDVKDEEGEYGEREDDVNLIDEWKQSKGKANHQYVWNRNQLLNVTSDVDYLLGLFEASHCNYNLERTEADPSFAEMVETAIKILSKGDQGYFLLAEGGRIDHGHHDTQAMKALDETSEFSKAIQKALELTNDEDTLIVVTSDHAHTMTYSGYADRGNDIFSAAGDADDDLPYATLTYANGPGFRPEENGHRHDFLSDDTHDIDYMFPATAPLSSETHGGEDVAIFARGPWSHLFKGVMEENVIPHIMAYAACVGDGVTVCDDVKNH